MTNAATPIATVVSDEGAKIVPVEKPKKVSRLKAVDPKAAEPSKPKILIFGDAGVGKTWTSLDFPKVYYIDTEGGANLDHYTDKLKKSGGVYFGPEQGSRDFATVIEEVKALATEDHDYKTLVIDSISEIYNDEIAKEQKRLGEKDAFGAAKKPATALSRELFGWVKRMDMNVIIIAHEKADWFKGEQTGFTFDAYDKIKYILHLAMRIAKQGSARVARVTKSRLEGFKDGDSIPWSYEEFAARFGNKDILEKAGVAIELATKEQLAELKTLFDVVKIDEKDIEKWLSKADVERFEDMDTKTLGSLITHIKTKIK